jgi:hypothetical protein
VVAILFLADNQLSLAINSTKRWETGETKCPSMILKTHTKRSAAILGWRQILG